MDKQTLIRTTVASAVAAAGLAVGGVALASADDQAPTAASQSGTIAFGHDRGPGGPGGRGDHVMFGGADLAKALGVSEAKLRTAMENIREDLKPADRPDGPPTDAQRDAMRAKLAKALAKELDLSEAKVTAALDKVQAAHQAEARSDLASRLDDAVKAGKLTSTDKASVLKAFDAGVLGGPGPR